MVGLQNLSFSPIFSLILFRNIAENTKMLGIVTERGVEIHMSYALMNIRKHSNQLFPSLAPNTEPNPNKGLRFTLSLDDPATQLRHQ